VTRARVLLVEDDADRVVLTRRALSDADVELDVDVAESGEQAIEQLADGPPPDLALLDLQLPGVDGFGVLDRLDEDRLTKIPVVVLTSSDETEDLMRSYELGANGFVTKPVDFDEFREAVGHIARFWLEINTPPGHADRL
jgi:CheY-like chemotaxis protein